METSAKRRSTIKDPDRLISALLEISNLVGSVMRLDDILDRIVRITADLLDVPVCSIYLIQKDGNLALRSNVGLEADLKEKVVIPRGEGLQWVVVQSNAIQATADATRDSRYKPLPSTLESSCRAFLGAPLRIQDEVIGLMTVRRMDASEFSHEQRKLLETVCKQVAIVIEKARMYEDKIQAEQLAAVAVSLSGLAHYIKNILFTSQIGEYLVDKGLNEWNDLDRVREGWKTLHQANQKIRKLVENMLNYSRKNKRELKPVNLNKMIAEIVESVQDQASLRRTEIHVHLDPQLDSVMLEPESIHDALLNLVTNAIDAIPEGQMGKVIIRAQRIPDQNNFKIEVLDNGIGIPEQLREKVFLLFFSTKGKKGTGIGLAVTKKMIEDHGGTIELDSTVGQGTCFRVFLPLKPVG
jgi:signal transduction histidine kinase